MRGPPLRPAALALAALALFGCAGAPPASEPVGPGDRPRRIVSLNLCADQLLVALADREQIAGLTRNADDRQMSAVAAEAAGLPILSNSAEQVLAIRPDLVIGMAALPSAGAGVRQGHGSRTLDLQNAETYADIVASIRQVAAAVGHPERGEAMIDRMATALAAIPRSGGGRVAAFYQRRGFLTGTGTLVDDLMRRTGYVNLAERLGKGPLARLSVEEMVAARPDVLIVESATDRVQDQGSEMLHHPALGRIPRISLPQAWIVCGGPAYVQAARAMASYPS